jgi:Glycosyltransferase 61
MRRSVLLRHAPGAASFASAAGWRGGEKPRVVWASRRGSQGRNVLNEDEVLQYLNATYDVVVDSVAFTSHLWKSMVTLQTADVVSV